MRTPARIRWLVATMACLPTGVLAQEIHSHLMSDTKRVVDGRTGSFGAQRERPGGPARPEHRELWGYGFFAPGLYMYGNRVEKARHLGAGIEWRPLGSFGVGAEGSAGGVGEEGAFAMLSVNGSYYFRDAPLGQKSIVPFVTGGYSTLFSEYSPESLMNFGAGVNYWLRGGDGLRFEVRHHVGAHGTRHYSILDFRIGLTLGRK